MEDVNVEMNWEQEAADWKFRYEELKKEAKKLQERTWDAESEATRYRIAFEMLVKELNK